MALIFNIIHRARLTAQDSIIHHLLFWRIFYFFKQLIKSARADYLTFGKGDI